MTYLLTFTHGGGSTAGSPGILQERKIPKSQFGLPKRRSHQYFQSVDVCTATVSAVVLSNLCHRHALQQIYQHPTWPYRAQPYCPTNKKTTMYTVTSAPSRLVRCLSRAIDWSLTQHALRMRGLGTSSSTQHDHQKRHHPPSQYHSPTLAAHPTTRVRGWFLSFRFCFSYHLMDGNDQ